ncbi:MAG: DNRLRE domain-containing protein [Flavobacterium sp.]|nr:DNRLRE domain-containing protein [Flavobacterium sp.]
MKKLLIFIILILSNLVCQLYAQNPILVENTKLTIPNLGGDNYTIGSNAELRITTPLTANGTVNLTSDSGWLILDGILPSQAIASHLSYISVNGQPAVNKVNIRVTNYLRGCVIMPHSPTFEALSLFKETAFTGAEMKCIPYKYYKSADLVSFDNTVSSFKLKKGYMATFAQNENGSGYSKVFIAEKEDIQISTLQVGLNDKVSFVRVFPWRYTDKKGFASGLPDFNREVKPAKLTNSGWFYHWGSSTAEDLTDVEFVPMKWNAKSFTDPRWNEINNGNYSSHVLGFNEPQSVGQANMTTEEQLKYWPKLMESGMRLGSPAPTNMTLFYEFMDKCDELNYRVDFVALHDYGEGTALSFYNFCKTVHDRTGRPIWVTEFNWGGTWTNSTPTYPAIAARITEIMEKYDTEGIIERYSIFNFDETVNDYGGAQNRAVFVTPAIPNYTFTPLGEAYRDNVAPMAYNAAEAIDIPLKLVAPQNLKVTNSNFAINLLTWDNFNTSGVGSFLIERSYNDETFQTIAQISGTSVSYNDTIPTGAFGDYKYRISTIEVGFPNSKYATVEIFVDPNNSYTEQALLTSSDGFVAESSGTFNSSLTYADLKTFPNFTREVYLTFDLSNLTQAAKSAKLNIFCQSFDKYADLELSIYCLPEYETNQLTWATRPNVQNALSKIWINETDHANSLLEFDISSCLASVLATQTKKATFVIKITSGNDALVKFTMSENTSNKPSIVISDKNPINKGVNSTIKMPPIFSDNMVLQRDKPIKVWGEVLPNASVAVNFDGQTYTALANSNGKFTTTLNAKSASASSYTLTVSSNNETFKYNDIVMGDVYLCGGESNMALLVNNSKTDQIANAIADSNYPNLRLFEVGKIVNNGSLINASDNTWKSASPERVINWSAIAFFVGRDMHKHINVPVGLINLSQDGATIDAFISPQAYTNDPILNAAKRTSGGGISSYYTTPSSLYNSMVSKVAGYSIKSFLWYQAESNATYWPVYKTMLKGLINDWRTQFNGPTLPWLFVQLPSYTLSSDTTNKTWAEIRDMQLQVSKEDPNTAMAVTIDLGETNNIDPTDKYTVAKRMIPQLKALVYGEPIVHKSPIYKWHQVQGANLTIAFDNIGGGLSATKAITEFEIAGSDKVYKTATATILSDNKIRLTNATIANPLYARYAFKNFSTASIFTTDTFPLPLSPFRTQSLNCNCN